MEPLISIRPRLDRRSLTCLWIIELIIVYFAQHHGQYFNDDGRIRKGAMLGEKGSKGHGKSHTKEKEDKEDV